MIGYSFYEKDEGGREDFKALKYEWQVKSNKM